MPDQIKVHFSDRGPLTDREIGRQAPAYPNVAKVEVNSAGSKKSLVVYSAPKKSDVRNSVLLFKGDVVQVHAAIPWFFSERLVFLGIFLKEGRLVKLDFRGYPLLYVPSLNMPGNLWEAWMAGGVVEVFDSRENLRKWDDLGKEFKLESIENIRGILSPIRIPGQDGLCHASDELTLVLEQRATLQANQLKVFGVGHEVAKQTVRLVQFPAALVCGDEGSSLNKLDWYIGILGLPYSWGREIWNSLLSEQARVAQLDAKHRPLSVPLLLPDDNSGHLWNVIYKVTSGPDEEMELKSHALELTSTEPDSWAQAEFPLLRDHLGGPVKAKLPLPSMVSIEAEAGISTLLELVQDPGLNLRLRHNRTLAASATSQAVRVGALDLTLAATPAERKGQQPQHIRWSLVRGREQGSEVKGEYEWREASADVDWSIEQASPGGQDDLPGEPYVGCPDEPGDPAPSFTTESRISSPETQERQLECDVQRERPLIIPVARQQNSGKPAFILNLREMARPRDTRQIDLELRVVGDTGVTASAFRADDAFQDVCSESAAVAQDQIVVLDREPFLVANVRYPALGSLKDAAESTVVATWKSYGLAEGAWQIRFPEGQDFCLALPPQGVGESMEKHKTVLEQARADFRFSPPALLSMRQRYYRQNFPEAPWNLRRLLEDPSRELPGAQVDFLQYELLYGLSCRIDYPFMRLVELSALIGEWVGPLPSRPRWIPFDKDKKQPSKVASTAYMNARLEWARLSKRLRQRLGIFELWDIQRLDTLELKNNVTCWIRNPDSAQERPAELIAVPGADLGNPFMEPDGQALQLAGGVTWGFESRNVYNAVMRPGPNGTWPKSSGGEIKDTRLSALGGYGHQMAAFDHFRSKVLADVAMGRTYSYTLERIGRIAGYWNRAKHVIVYERTVVRSRQFGTSDLSGTADEQNPLEGRAVVRKVAEYVEILQHVRKYPDSSSALPRSTGPVTECSFSDDPVKVVRFAVRSSWGTDLGSDGWKVPLWRVGEKPEDVYPKPVVQLTVMTNVHGENKPGRRTIRDPENLYFYTDTTVPTKAEGDPAVDLSNTDTWPPVEGVDWVEEARLVSCSDPSFEGGTLQQTSAGDVLVPSGFRPCTFLLEPGEHPVNLLAHRDGKPMGAELSSVTLCRAAFEKPLSPDQMKETIKGKYRELTRSVEDKAREWAGRIPGDEIIPANLDPTEGLEQLCAHLKSQAHAFVEGELKKNEQVINGLVDKLTDRAFQSIDKALESYLGQAESSVFGKALQDSLAAIKGLSDRRTALVEEISREVDVLGHRIEAFLPSPAVLTDSALGALLLVREQLTDVVMASKEFKHRLDSKLELDRQRLSELEILASAYIDHLDGALNRIQQQTDSAARVPIEIEKAQRSVPFIQGIQKALDKVRSYLNAISAQLAQARQALTLLRSLRVRFDDMEEKERRAVVDEVQTLLNQAIDWMGKLGQVPATEIKQLEKVQEKLTEVKRNWICALKDALIGKVDDLFRRVPDSNQLITLADTDWSQLLRDQKRLLLEELKSEIAAQRARVEIAPWLNPPIKIDKKVDELCSDLQKQAQDFLAKVGRDAAAIRKYIENQRDELVRSLDRTFGDDVRLARKIAGEVEAKSHDAFQLVRAFGKPPDVSGLKFDRPEVAFFYDELNARVDVTPVIARAAQAAAVVDALKPLGIDLPVQQLGEQLIPAPLKNFDLSSILPNIAGIPLKNLFGGLKIPASSDDRIKVQHGADSQTRRAWVNVDANCEVPGNQVLFAVGPLAVRVDKPRFEATARLEVDTRGTQTRHVHGRLTGSWQLQIGSFDLITFKETPLEFDDAGHIDFRVKPESIEMAPALTFINALLDTISPGGVTTRFDGDGVVSSLSLPIPDTQVGAFGFSGLQLGASLALRAGGGFNIGVTAFLGRRDAPFTLTIFILGGAGYIELGSRYFPATGQVEATADMAIAASASLAIALGPIRGGVAVYVGVTAQYSSVRGGGLTVGLMFMVRGYVSVLSIASATITLRLDGQYQGGALVGTGYLEIKIKICWCFTLEVSESVTYTLGRVGSSQAWFGGPQAVTRVASLGPLPELPDGGAPSRSVFSPDELRLRVDDYFAMLE